MRDKKMILILVIVLIPIAIITLNYFIGDENEKVYSHQSFGGMYIEEKGHYVEPGEYQQMWIIGYNAYEDTEGREPFKVFIKDANVYNLIEENQEYVISFSAKYQDESNNNIYSLDWILLPDGGQMRGDGLIDKN
ncbi:hypothetical protein [Alkalihalophilus marmarensis]|uniref:hypothetical protein n=1 Tax=Alkalihalophilus marmarensis TaxID=521377 RepID=UPI002DBD951A|nr:hypothetical protein [Alkalihalophilus marmarensis]MEC2074175.1 hypothetical protein [Alkalihalophilus marmarensis]